jgi:hypothetical protein
MVVGRETDIALNRSAVGKRSVPSRDVATAIWLMVARAAVSLADIAFASGFISNELCNQT